VDVAVDQAGDEVLAAGLDDPGSTGYLALTGRAGTEDPVPADDGDGVGDRRAAGPVP
jgi:hypothetical protein